MSKLSPVNRLREFYAEQEARQTVEYVTYGLKRIFGQQTFGLYHFVEGEEILFGLMFGNTDDTYLTRFRVLRDESGEEILKRCNEAASAIVAMQFAVRRDAQ